MAQYFYLDGNSRLGPFSIEELKTKSLSRDTKIWYYGLDDWRRLSEITELMEIINSFPPELKSNNPTVLQINSSEHEANLEVNTNKIANLGKRNIIWVIMAVFSALILSIIVYIVIKNYKENNLYKEISSSAYKTDTDFQIYVNKFYRDLEFYGIFPKKPKNTIIKFAKLDQLDNTTHIHGISYGINDDDKIEIYINPSTWESFNKPMRYYLMYHELAHDVLNVDDLDNISLNEGKLMYPAITSYKKITMDEFIEHSHDLFEEISNK